MKQDDLFRGSEPLRANDRAQSDRDSKKDGLLGGDADSGDSSKKDGLLGGDADHGDDDSGLGETRRDHHGEGDSDAKDTDSDTTDARSLDGKD